MRVYSSLVTVFPIHSMGPGAHVEKDVAWSVASKVSQVLELTYPQREASYKYLIGRLTVCQYEELGLLSPADLKAFTDFKAWYHCEFQGWIKPTGHLVANLNSGCSVIFTHNWL